MTVDYLKYIKDRYNFKNLDFDSQYHIEVDGDDLFYLIKQAEKAERYEKTLFALLKLSRDSDQDVLSDIITDALNGHDLMEQYKKFAIEGENEFEKFNA